MRALSFILCVLSFCAIAAVQDRNGKRADIEIIDARARRIQDKISVDGKARIATEKPIQGLTLTFDFLDLRNGVITTETDEISLDTLKPGEAPSFHTQTASPPGSVKFRMRAFDGFQQELRVANPGPFIIE